MYIQWDTLASVATAIGVGVGVYQLHLSKRLAQTEFEDSLTQQYRALVETIPVDYLIGKEVPTTEWPRIRELAFNYLDLSNEQVALRANRRVSKDTWRAWCEGIQENLAKPAFARMWREIKEHAPETFSYLRKREDSDYRGDPVWF